VMTDMGLVLDVAPNIFQNVGAAVATSTESGQVRSRY